MEQVKLARVCVLSPTFPAMEKMSVENAVGHLAFQNAVMEDRSSPSSSCLRALLFVLDLQVLQVLWCCW